MDKILKVTQYSSLAIGFLMATGVDHPASPGGINMVNFWLAVSGMAVGGLIMWIRRRRHYTTSRR